MRRMTPGALLLVLIAVPLRAQDDKGPTAVTIGSVQAEADELHDAVASPATDNYGVRGRASAFFEGLQSKTPAMRPKPHPMDREPVTGRPGTMDGMYDEAHQRWEHYKFTTTEIPDSKLAAAIAYAQDLRGMKRVDFDAKMAENQMGEFRYSKDKLDDGVIKLNSRMTVLATRLGEAFCYATLVHEAAHAKARSEGRLDAAHTIDNEVEAYRVQYLWLKVIDPTQERIIVLHYQLKNQLRDHPEDRVSRLAFDYVHHLLELWDTKGDEMKLKDLVRKMGYQENGVDPASSSMKA